MRKPLSSRSPLHPRGKRSTAIDYILGLIPVKMIGTVLTFLHVKKFFSIDLGILVRHSTVAIPLGSVSKNSGTQERFILTFSS